MKLIKKSLSFILSLTLIVIINAVIGISSIRIGIFPRLQNYLVTSFMVTMRHQYVANIVASASTVEKIMALNTVATISEGTNTEDINIVNEDAEADEPDDLFKYTEKPDVSMTNISGSKYKGYIFTVKDPKRIKLSVSKSIGENGTYIKELVKQENGIAGVNGSGFVDVEGKGNGGVPTGIVIKGGEIVYYEKGVETYGLIGFNKNGVLVLGNYSINEIKKLNIQEGVSFYPFLIVNNKPVKIYGDGGWGINPRTVIGQKEDGSVVFLVIDGRQLHSIGATIKEIQDIMISEGCVNAANLDGGSSSVMYYEDKLINSPSSKFGERPLPSAWIVK
ncbi:phosphodiester glycosidase family protein [Clostridium sp. CS001]|uniref:phosphodiester glycosidase family protein n=1 Tax=Clostridium sp. CS001 TaxID=2880648 RepID=UPI001CF236A5|nr:phosphodiester glycosidase family protein [Clostridium sp. CS001]MCB2289256.1 phosphodiester glycosidase family protein [Clostridium sp. CS001]